MWLPMITGRRNLRNYQEMFTTLKTQTSIVFSCKWDIQYFRLDKYFFKTFHFLFMGICMCLRDPGTSGCEKRASDPLFLELQVTVSLAPWSQTLVLCKSSRAFDSWAISESSLQPWMLMKAPCDCVCETNKLGKFEIWIE